MAALGLALAAAVGCVLQVSLNLDPGSVLTAMVMALALGWRSLAMIRAGRPWALRPSSALGAALALPAAWGLGLLVPTAGRMSALATALAAVLALGVALSSWEGAGTEPCPAKAGDGAAPLLAGLAFYALLLPLRAWALGQFSAQPSNSLQLFFMPRTGYEGIPSAPFREPLLVLWPLLWWGATLAAAAWAWRKPSWRRLLLLAGMGFLGKLAMATLSGSGLQVLPQKIEAVSTAYFNIARVLRPQGLWNFISHFNQLQPQLGTHGESHPFGPELVYWLLEFGQPPSPWVPALTLAALTSMIPLALAGILVELGKPLRWGLAAALLYLAAPPSSILASSGIDSTFSLLFAGVAWAALHGVRMGVRGRPWLALAGLGVFAASLISSAAAFLVLGLALAALAAAWSGRLAWRALPGLAAWLLGPGLLLHLALTAATGGGFNILGVYRYASYFQFSPSARPWALWSWLNPLLFLGYAGAGTLGLAFSAGAARLNGRRRLGAAGLLPLALLTAAWMQGLGLAEAQRIFHWGYGGLVLL
ncbi:MAG TPA: hypothetical protein VNZ67_03180, partial [bacterium]|nr:hypothetical protein [bacterium]